MPAHTTQQEKVAIVTGAYLGTPDKDLSALFSVSVRTISSIKAKAKDSATDSSLRSLLDSEYLRPTPLAKRKAEKRGSKYRVQPGGFIANTIRSRSLNEYKRTEPAEAANNIIDDLIAAEEITIEDVTANETENHKKRRESKELGDRHRHSITRWLSRAEVFRIRLDPKYYEGDVEERRKPIVFKDGISELSKERGFRRTPAYPTHRSHTVHPPRHGASQPTSNPDTTAHQQTPHTTCQCYPEAPADLP